MGLTIEPLDSRKHLRSHFCCGKDSLDNYIRKQASQDIKKKVATVFVAIDDADDKAKVLAYYTLSAYTVEVTSLDDAFVKSLPRYPLLPATLIGRLAVDRLHTGKKLGKLMLIDALFKCLEVSNQVASLAVIAEALDEEAVNFYLKYGFQRFKHHPRSLYLPMKSIELGIRN